LPTPIIERVKKKPPLLFDGGFGSRLIDHGLPSGMAPEAWVMEKPDVIRQLHRDYVSAGSDVIVTCTFGGNRFRLKKAGLDEEIAEVNLKAVELALESASETTYVAADLGPTGEFFEPHGRLTEALAEEVYKEQVSILKSSGIDFFLLETFFDLKEALICLKSCREVAPDIPVGASMTFNQTPRGYFTVMGNAAEASLNELAEKGAFLVGANCTLEAEGMSQLATTLKNTIKAPLLFQANAGSPQITAEGVVYPQGPDEFATWSRKILDMGVAAIGGCCGSTPDHIRVLRTIIDSM